jgi:hypothetical protein
VVLYKNNKKYKEMETNHITYPEIGKTYKHYKGGKYEVITLAKHTNNNEPLVIYKSIHFGSVHARPLFEWYQSVEQIKDEYSQIVPRFERID